MHSFGSLKMSLLVNHFRKYTIYLLKLLITTQSATAAVYEERPYEFVIERDPERLATHFQISSNNTNVFTVEKNTIRKRRYYNLFNANGLQASCSVRISQVRTSICFWTTQITLYDSNGLNFGIIDGEVVPSKNPKFDLYESDEKGNFICIGTAFFEVDCNIFTIFTPGSDSPPLAKLEWIKVPNELDFWRVKVDYPECIDDRLILIFATFVIDFQYNF